jgi:SAM-dependent methyltransferase
VYIKLAVNQGPFTALRFVLLENYYHFKYRIKTPYRYESIESTNQLSAQKDAVENVPGSYYLFHLGLDKIKLPPEKISLLDMGCGSGRFVSVGIQRGFAHVRGVDLDKTGLEVAKGNAALASAKGGGKSKYELIFQDAGSYAIPDDVNLLYFFNPFGSKTMQFVVNNIIESYSQKPRDIYVIYNLPAAEYLFIQAGFKEIYTLDSRRQKELSVLKLAAQ